MARRRRRFRNPSGLVTTLVTVGAAAAAATAVGVAMVRIRNTAKRDCTIGSKVAGGIIGTATGGGTDSGPVGGFGGFS